MFSRGSLAGLASDASAPYRAADGPGRAAAMPSASEGVGAPGGSGGAAAVTAVLDRLRAAVDEAAGIDYDQLDASQLPEVVGQLHGIEGALTTAKSKAVRAAQKTGVADQVGARDTTGWLKSELGMSGRAAKRTTELARALEGLPAVADALRAGQISTEHAAALSRARRRGVLPDRELEGGLLDIAAESRPELLARAITTAEAAAADGMDADRAERLRHSRREASIVKTHDGMWRIHALLAPSEGEVAAAAMEAFTVPDPSTVPVELRRSPAQMRADALTQALTFALDHGDAPVSGGAVPHVNVLADIQTFTDPDADDVKPATTAFDTPLAPETLKRILCDAGVRRIVTDGPSQPLDVGRSTRHWSPAQTAALQPADGHCRFPGCDAPAGWTRIHHVQFWRNGGPTDTDNGVLLCLIHHILVHEAGWRLLLHPRTRKVTTVSPDGATVLTSMPRDQLERRPDGPD